MSRHNVNGEPDDFKKARIKPAKPCLPRTRMKAYDALPSEVRRAFAECAFDFDVRKTLRALKSGRVTVNQVLTSLVVVEHNLIQATADREGRNV